MLLYIDPGIGSVIIQAVIAGTVGALYAFKAYGKRIKNFFKKKKDKDS
ncbi:MAG: hypothetical protein WAU36_10970 [Cyclobacteriaceae bacterium]